VGMTTELIPYRDAEIAVQGEFVAVRQMAEAIGLDWNGQRQLIERSPWSEGWTCVLHVRLPGEDRARDHYFLHRRRVSMWVANISTGHIKNETVRTTVIQWQNEIADVLADYYEGKLKSVTQHPKLGSTGYDRRKLGSIVQMVEGLCPEAQVLVLTRAMEPTVPPVEAYEPDERELLLQELGPVQPEPTGDEFRDPGWPKD
jgi:P22_AR N-terminal domain